MRTMYSFRLTAQNFSKKLISVFVAVSIFSLVFVWLVSMRDLIDELVVNELEYMVTDIINKSVYECVNASQFTHENMTIVSKDSAGYINSVSIEPYYANLMKSKIAANINKSVNQITDDDVNITLGMVVGYCNLGSWGPEIPLAVLPNTNVDIDFETTLSPAGINQVMSNVNINVNVYVSAMMPFLKCTSTIHSTVLVASTIIVGKVPNTYIEIEDK